MKTPQTEAPALARALGLAVPVYLKREDLHPHGSHKGRSLPRMIKTYADDDRRNFVISSSGNAALAAIMAVEQYNKNNPGEEIKLKALVGKQILKEKLKALESAITHYPLLITISQVDRPKQSALLYAKEHGAKLLRQSTDDSALTGYLELAQELNQIQNLQAIFIPTSSGTTAQALGEAFQTLAPRLQIHIVQTIACHPIASACLSTPSPRPSRRAGYSPSYEREIISSPPSVLSSPHTRGGEPLYSGSEGWSLANAIVDKVARRKDKVVEVVKNSGGAGWIITDDEIKDAIALVKQTANLDLSPNSALSVAGLKKAAAGGFIFSGPIVCLITGP